MLLKYQKELGLKWDKTIYMIRDTCLRVPCYYVQQTYKPQTQELLAFRIHVHSLTGSKHGNRKFSFLHHIVATGTWTKHELNETYAHSSWHKLSLNVLTFTLKFHPATKDSGNRFILNSSSRSHLPFTRLGRHTWRLQKWRVFHTFMCQVCCHGVMAMDRRLHVSEPDRTVTHAYNLIFSTFPMLITFLAFSGNHKGINISKTNNAWLCRKTTVPNVHVLTHYWRKEQWNMVWQRNKFHCTKTHSL